MVKILWPINVVIVEDNYPDAEYIVELLQEEEDNYVWENFIRLGPAMEHVSEGGTSVVLLDLNLPDSSRSDTVPTFMERFPDQAVVVVSAADDLELAALAMQMGVQEYLIKGHFDGFLLRRAIITAIEKSRLQRELRAQQEHEMRLLRGLVPFCAECGKIRDRSDNKWYRADHYIEKYAAVDATHGMCPECMGVVVAGMIEEDKSLNNGVKAKIIKTLKGQEDDD